MPKTTVLTPPPLMNPLTLQPHVSAGHLLQEVVRKSPQTIMRRHNGFAVPLDRPDASFSGQMQDFVQMITQGTFTQARRFDQRCYGVQKNMILFKAAQLGEQSRRAEMPPVLQTLFTKTLKEQDTLALKSLFIFLYWELDANTFLCKLEGMDPETIELFMAFCNEQPEKFLPLKDSEILDGLRRRKSQIVYAGPSYKNTAKACRPLLKDYLRRNIIMPVLGEFVEWFVEHVAPDVFSSSSPCGVASYYDSRKYKGDVSSITIGREYTLDLWRHKIFTRDELIEKLLEASSVLLQHEQEIEEDDMGINMRRVAINRVIDDCEVPLKAQHNIMALIRQAISPEVAACIGLEEDLLFDLAADLTGKDRYKKLDQLLDALMELFDDAREDYFLHLGQDSLNLAPPAVVYHAALKERIAPHKNIQAVVVYDGNCYVRDAKTNSFVPIIKPKKLKNIYGAKLMIKIDDDYISRKAHDLKKRIQEDPSLDNFVVRQGKMMLEEDF